MEPILGMIYSFAGDFAPVGYAMCDGQLVPIAENTALFAVIGTIYGGNGVENFALPKLTGPNGTRYIIAIRGFFPARP